MRRIIIEGPANVKGSVAIQGSKNSMLINLTLPLLTTEGCVIENVPRINDVETNLSILQSLGATIKWLDKHTVSIRCNDISLREIDPQTSIKTTTSKYFIPLLVERLGEVTIGRSLGDNIGGDRGFSKFIELLESFGIRHEQQEDKYRFYKSDRQKSSQVELKFPSFSATVGLLLMNVVGNSQMVVVNANVSPEIENSIEMLRSMGADIKISGNVIKINGVKDLKGVRFRNLSDHNVLFTYVACALATNGDLNITNFDNIKLEPMWEFLDNIGAIYSVKDSTITIRPSLSRLKPVKIFAFMWPEFHSDWQALAAAVLTQVVGESVVTDDLFEERFAYVKELEKMGANIKFCNPVNSRFKDNLPHGIKVIGKSALKGCTAVAPDLRGGAAIIVAGLAAGGRTVIENIEQIERGYEDIIGNLSQIGAKIFYD